MNISTKAIIGVIAVVIIIGAAISAIYITNPNLLFGAANNTNQTPSPTTNPSTAPSSSPTATPQGSSKPNPTSKPTSQPSGGGTSTNPTAQPTATPSTVTLNGAGATFPALFINATIIAYSNVKPWVQVNYQGVGSGTGISSLTSRTVDFAGSDAPLTDSQRIAAPNVLHIPETIGAVTLAYNVAGVSTGLHLTGDIIAKMFLGTITKWNDPAITTLNPSMSLPNQNIVTVHRAESSGTTNVFTKYLATMSSAWNSQVGAGNSVQWPAGGLAESGNAAVAATVTTTQYSIGYVELAYALENNMTVAAIQNPQGNYIMPTLASTTAAVSAGATGLPAGDQSWTSVSLLNENDAQAYPIVTFSYLMVYKELNVIPNMTQDKATALVQYIWYIVHDGQTQAAPLQYASLPSNVVALDETSIRSITFNGQTIAVS